MASGRFIVYNLAPTQNKTSTQYVSRKEGLSMTDVVSGTKESAGFRRELSTLALMGVGLGSIIGSGWLFGAWRTAAIAGPDAIWAWVLGAVVVMIIGLTFSEMGAMLPEPGGLVRYTHITHGPLTGFVSGWANWIAIVSVIPVEAEASVQYMSSWPYAWAHSLYVSAADGQGELSATGLSIAGALMLVYFGLNYWGVKLFARSNTTITVFKVVVPIMTGLALMASGFHSGNFHVGLAADTPTAAASVLTAVATAGIVFSFNGFQSPLHLVGEAANPSRSIPFAVMGAVALSGIIYVLLQVAYIGAVPPDMLLAHGWHGVDFSSPFAQLALLLNLNWLAMLLYADAFVSPSGTGITFTATTARMLFGMERNGSLPKMFGHIDPASGVPRRAMWFNLFVSFLFLLFFRGWGILAAVISVATIVSFLTGPVSAAAFRVIAADMPRPFRLPGLPAISALAFVMAAELLYWACWPLTGQVVVLMLAAVPVYAFSQGRRSRHDFADQLHASLWFICFFPAMALVSWAGSSKFGGHDIIPWGWDLAAVAVVALAFFHWGVRSANRWSATAAFELKVAAKEKN
jgi:amino acid transporter